MANTRENESEEDKESRLKRAKVMMANTRKNETEDERESRLKKKKIQTANKRQRPRSMYDGRNALNVLNGHQIVPELKDSKDAIGAMDIVCPDCSALK